MPVNFKLRAIARVRESERERERERERAMFMADLCFILITLLTDSINRLCVFEAMRIMPLNNYDEKCTASLL